MIIDNLKWYLGYNETVNSLYNIKTVGNETDENIKYIEF